MPDIPGFPPGPSIRGAVEGIEVTQEPDVRGTSTIYRFYLQRYDETTKQPIPPCIPVEMRGCSVNNAPAFDGSLNERDWVEIPGIWQGQILHPDRVYIIPRGAFFTSRTEGVPLGLFVSGKFNSVTFRCRCSFQGRIRERMRRAQRPGYFFGFWRTQVYCVS